MQPTGTSDGRWVTYTSTAGMKDMLLRKLASGAGRPEVLAEIDGSAYATDWSQDDQRLLIQIVDDSGDTDIYLLDLAAGEQPQPLRATQFNEGQARFSPDGRWIAYTSLESGNPEIFVESLGEDGARYRISTDGGSLAAWSATGDALYYADLAGGLLVTEIVIAGRSLTVGKTRRIASDMDAGLVRTYSIDRATGRLIIQRSVQDRVSNHLQLVTGWQNLLDGRRN